MRLATRSWRRTLGRTLASRLAKRHGSSSSMTASELEAFLAKPSWSVRALLPSADDVANASSDVTPARLRHLLRLAALPRPRDEREEARMIATLASQLHFVRAIQGVDTRGVEPLRSLRDETARGQEEQTWGLDNMQDALAKECHLGKFYKRIRRQDVESNAASKEAEDWDVLKHAERRVGGFFVVEGAPKDE